MKVLHITAWYPSSERPGWSPFVQRHVLALQPFADQRVWHLSVTMARSWGLDRRAHLADRTLLLSGPFRSWRILEWASTLLVLLAWFTRDRSFRPDLVNFCIAYPNCVHTGILKFFIRRPFVITEHYSAYHYGFNTASQGLERIRRIFRQGTPVIAVSRALVQDIERFARTTLPSVCVVHNVVDGARFHHRAEPPPEEGRFFALAYWRPPKRPDLLIEALSILVSRGFNARLRIGGSGDQLDAVRVRSRELGVEDRIDLLGDLSPDRVAEEMNRAHLFLHASDHETYAVVCAEALCCGTPVVASMVGGIPEYLDPERGRVVPDPSPETWAETIEAIWESAWHADRYELASRSIAINSPDAVGARYASFLQDVLDKRTQRSQ
ncbi:MAG: glycosyltransferase family 4 protein [Flavobacteriales bacterium]